MGFSVSHTNGLSGIRPGRWWALSLLALLVADAGAADQHPAGSDRPGVRASVGDDPTGTGDDNSKERFVPVPAVPIRSSQPGETDVEQPAGQLKQEDDKGEAASEPAGPSLSGPAAATPEALETAKTAKQPAESAGKTVPPEDRDNELEIIDARAASFQRLTPGKTTAAQAREVMGEPLEEQMRQSSTALIYRVGPFPKVEVVIDDDVVSSIVIHLKAASPPESIAGELGLTPFRPLFVPGGEGKLLGQAYPERGVLFAYETDSQPAKVSHILLEPISAETFLLRAMHDTEHRYRHDLADLRYAAKLDPANAHGPRLLAEIYRQLGRYSRALEAVERAVQLGDEASDARLLRARIIGEMGDYTRALKETRQIAGEDNAPAHVKARAECQLGDLLVAGGPSEVQQAIEHHLAAIKLAAPLAKQDQADVRHATIMVLVDAHLGVAEDIALGSWQRKAETVPKWLNSAAALAGRYVDNDRGDASLRLLVQRRQLAVNAAMLGELELGDAAEQLLETGRRLIALADDPLYQRQLEWELGQGLFDAARVEHARGQYGAALRYASNAVALLEPAGQEREITPETNYLLGRVFHLVGALHAIHNEDHAEAVVWYEKSLPKLRAPLPASARAESGLVGERLVSMGVSYWETGDRQRGIELTKQGTELVEQAVQNDQLDEKSLAVPYGNLAAMHQTLGNEAEARTLAARAASLERPAETPKKR